MSEFDALVGLLDDGAPTPARSKKKAKSPSWFSSRPPLGDGMMTEAEAEALNEEAAPAPADDAFTPSEVDATATPKKATPKKSGSFFNKFSSSKKAAAPDDDAAAAAAPADDVPAPVELPADDAPGAASTTTPDGLKRWGAMVGDDDDDDDDDDDEAAPPVAVDSDEVDETEEVGPLSPITATPGETETPSRPPDGDDIVAESITSFSP